MKIVYSAPVIIALSMVTIACGDRAILTQPDLSTRMAPMLDVDDFQFRDLNKNGQLDPYEDWRLSDEERANDLLARMTVEEKAGAMMHASLPTLGGYDNGTGYDHDAASDLIGQRHITNGITRLSLAPRVLAEENNRLQELAEAARLGIPMTISTDPRNHFQYTFGASTNSDTSMNSKWPEPLGFAALDDEELVREFGEIARREYRAVGIHMALSPQLDLLTEPRWPRGLGTFGSDAERVSRLGAAYVQGFQGAEDGLAADGVITIVKHWVGYGAQPDGFDAHNHYGRFANPGEAFDQHVFAFEGALESGAGGVMPAYPIITDVGLNGEELEPVAVGYNEQLINGLLRQELGFDGLVLSDWAITVDCNERCLAPTAEAPQRPQDISTAWGVEELSVRERYVKAITAGVDQFGGTADVEPLIAAVEAGDISSERIDQSVRRILLPKFRMGLFENPFVDAENAESQFNVAENLELAEETVREAQILLRNEDGALPFATGSRVWLHDVDPGAAQEAGLVVVENPEEADFAIVRASTPSEALHPHHFFGGYQKEGRLDFRPGDPAYDALTQANSHVPTVLAIFLDRPAILTEIQDHSTVILANYGANDAAILDVILGNATARGRLPYALPSSMAAIENQHSGIPDDGENPLFVQGEGIAIEMTSAE